MNRCGCTIQAPTCPQGEMLFATYLRRSQTLHTPQQTPSDALWKAYDKAQVDYHNHVDGRREGDMRLRRETSQWVVEIRLHGQWVFQFASRQEAFLRGWFRSQGYWRYAPIDTNGLQDRVTGYYRERVTISAPPVVHKPQTTHASESYDSSPPPSTHPPRLRPEADLQTRLAIFITILVTRLTGSPTTADRYSIQSRAITWLAQQGIESILSEKLHTIDQLINVAIQQRASRDDIVSG